MSNVAVVVIGDFGRSPRMQNHSLSLAKNGHKVSIIAVKGSSPVPEIQEHPNIEMYLMNEYNFNGLPRLLRYAAKSLYQTLMLLVSLLFFIPKPQSIIVQNPPSVPTLPCVWLACKLRSAKFVLDWHNYGYSILRMSVSEKSVVLRLYKWMEFYFGAKAHKHFCVSKAMKDDLASRGFRDITVLYDKAPERFRSIDWDDDNDVERVHELLKKLALKEEGLRVKSDGEETLLTERVAGSIQRKSEERRPFFLLSSTSWTEDEDFGVLLAALVDYDARENAKRIVCIVTGKGPMKEFYLEKISGLRLRHVTFVTPWLDIEDYPLAVAMCDLGVCLHTSSSSLDLPMKIVDMFGCGVPVLACNYKCIGELVKVEETGLLFADSMELCEHLIRLTSEMVVGDGKSLSLRLWKENLRGWTLLRWDDNWNQLAADVFSTK